MYPVLKAMEEQGQVRRGYFVAGLGAAQFAQPGAVDRLRELPARSPTTTRRRSCWPPTDPAQPYGAALPWPESHGPAGAGGRRVRRAAWGQPAAYLERGGHSLVTFPPAADHPQWADGLAGLVRTGRVRKLEITKIDGLPTVESDLAEALRSAGFTDGYRGLTLGR